MIHKGWRMLFQNFRSIAHTPGLFKTLCIIRIYSKHWANIQIYLNVYFVMKTNTNIYSSTKYSNIRIFKYLCSSLWWLKVQKVQKAQKVQKVQKETFWWDILTRHFYETFWQDIFMRHFNQTYWWILKNFNYL